MKRIVAGLLILCFLLLFGCSPKPAPMPGVISHKIALGMGSMNHPIHRMVQHGFFEGAANVSADAAIVGLDEGSAKDLQEKWKFSLENNDVQGMLLWSGDDTFYQFMREMKKEHGTVFVIPHFQHEYMDTKDFISANLYVSGRKLGETAADQMIEALAEQGITSGSIGITRTGDITDAICDGFRDRIAEMAPQFTVLPQVFGSLEVNHTALKLVPLIEDNLNLVGGFASHDGDTQAWVMAAEQTQRTDLVLVGVDYSEITMEALKEGMVCALVSSDLYRTGYEGAKTLVRILGGDAPKTEEEWRQTFDPVVITQTQNYQRYRDIVDAVVNSYT